MVLNDSQTEHSDVNQGERHHVDASSRHADFGMKRSVFAPLFKFMYRVLNCSRRRRIGSVLIDIICRFEHGAMFSQTARELLSKYHQVHIGPYSYGPCFTPGYLPPHVHIGNYTSMAGGVRIVNENHPMTKLSTHPLLYGDHSDRVELKIGHDVWLGFDAIILPGCQEIGTGAIIGAGSVVTKNIPPYAVAVGNPARVLRYRFPPEVCAKLLDSNWWNQDYHAAESLQEKLGADITDALTAQEVGTP